MVIVSPSFTSAIGPPTHASGRDVADHQAVRAAGEAAVGDQADALAQPLARSAPPVTDSISRMPGPPTGPSPRITTTSPGLIFRAWIAAKHASSPSKTFAGPVMLALLQPRHLRHRPLRGEVAVQDDDVPVRVHRLVERHDHVLLALA